MQDWEEGVSIIACILTVAGFGSFKANTLSMHLFERRLPPLHKGLAQKFPGTSSSDIRAGAFKLDTSEEISLDKHYYIPFWDRQHGELTATQENHRSVINVQLLAAMAAAGPEETTPGASPEGEGAPQTQYKVGENALDAAAALNADAEDEAMRRCVPFLSILRTQADSIRRHTKPAASQHTGKIYILRFRCV